VFANRRPVSLQGPIKLAPGQTELEIHYTALSFSVPEKNEFRYKLEGLDTDWVEVGTRRVAYYSNLKPGTYRFRVLGSNNDGVWNDKGASLGFVLQPHFYQTTWFYTGGILAIGFAGFGLQRGRIRHLRERQQHLMQLVEERTKDLAAAHRQLVEASRKAGMAEVASGVLHNIGNVLNSVNVSAGLIKQQLTNSRQNSIRKMGVMLRDHADDLAAFLSGDEKGRQIPEYLVKLGDHISSEQIAILKEIESLCKNVDHIKDIVAMQQGYAKFSGVIESVSVAELAEEALRLNATALARHDIEIIREFEPVPNISTDRHKVLLILVNLISNAKYACDDGPHPTKRVTIRILKSEGETIRVSVIDNGVGIVPENQTRIFSHGFTTRKAGHGFGLHSSALAAKELGGTLTSHSEGIGKGAAFTLEIPVQAKRTAG
jgi:signal transduction histidine kinase